MVPRRVHHAHVARWTTVRRVIAVRGLRRGKIGVPLLTYGYQDESLGGQRAKREIKNESVTAFTLSNRA
ncbi:hypothetical protein TNCV_3644811 [Trichonephila clavipes]|nr:hypothetical protein TNCV_3644811 [Trichonephila clavipes]